jgi:hypothetical protein
MGADAKRAAFFVDTAAKSLASGARTVVAHGPALLRTYVLWAFVAGVLGALGGALLVLGLGLDVTAESVRIGIPPTATVGKIQAASLLPGLVVGVVLRRHLCPSLHWRPVIAVLSAFAAILVVRLFTLVEILHEAPGGSARGALLRSGEVLRTFGLTPTDVYGTFTDGSVATLVLWDVGFVGIAAFVAAVFSRLPAER